VTVGLERAHAQCLGQGEGLLVVGFSLHDIGGVGLAYLALGCYVVVACGLPPRPLGGLRSHPLAPRPWRTSARPHTLWWLPGR
jgi:hypothetical protein